MLADTEQQSESLNVVCFLWNDPGFRHAHLYRYGARDVNILSSMLERHLKRPHRLFCVTDDPTGIDPSVYVIPMPDEVKTLGTYYPKLYAFHADWDIFGERMLLLDLDCVIVRDLDPLLDTDAHFLAWETNKVPPDRKARFNTSFVLMDAGAFPQVYTYFNEEALKVCDEAGFERGDQGWVSYILDNHGCTIPKFNCGIESFTPIQHTGLPDTARIVFFNGRSHPSMEKCQAVSWVRENWR